MQSRFLKQLIYVFFYLAVFAVILFGIYIFVRLGNTSCFDNRRNQDETQVDCGGPCEPCELKALDPIRIAPVLIFDNGDSTLSSLAELRNPNDTYGVDQLLYTIKFYGPNKTLITSLTKDSFIYPGEIKFIVEAGLNIDPTKVVSAELELSELSWKSVQEFPLPKTQVRDVTVQIEPETSRVLISGIIINQNSFPLAKVTVNAILFNKFSVRAGVSQTSLDGMAAFEQRQFKITVSGVHIPTLGESENVKISVNAKR